jgi:hypothetical protein
VRFYQRRANEFWEKMGAGAAEPGKPSLDRRKATCPHYLARVYRAKARNARKAYEAWFERTYAKWKCVHEHEGAWNANTGNGYYGGLQMTPWFQQTYGPEFWRRWGTADRWPVYAQLIAAERAWKQDGDFGQWGTAPACGLPT